MRLHYLMTLLCLAALIGCDTPDSTTSTVNVNTVQNEAVEPGIDLDPQSLEKLASWDATSKASAELTIQLADIMAEVQDEESATAAIAQLRELAPKFAAVNRAEKAMGEPSKEDRTLVLKNLAEAHKKFDASYTPLVENEKLKAIVGQAIDDAYVGNVTE